MIPAHCFLCLLLMLLLAISSALGSSGNQAHLAAQRWQLRRSGKKRKGMIPHLSARAVQMGCVHFAELLRLCTKSHSLNAADSAGACAHCTAEPKASLLQFTPSEAAAMASLCQLASSTALRPGHRRGGAAAALRQPLAARPPGAVQGRRGTLVVLAATYKARAGRPRGSRFWGLPCTPARLLHPTLPSSSQSGGVAAPTVAAAAASAPISARPRPPRTLPLWLLPGDLQDAGRQRNND